MRASHFLSSHQEAAARLPSLKLDRYHIFSSVRMQNLRSSEDGDAAASGRSDPPAQPALSSAGADIQARSQMAVIATPGVHDLDSAVSPERPLRSRLAHASHSQYNGVPPSQLAVPQPQGSSAEPAPPHALPLTPPAVGTPAAQVADGSPGDATATPFDNVLSVLDRIRQRPHTPWTAGSPGGAVRQSYSPVQYLATSQASAGPRGGGRAVRASPYAAPQRPQPSRLAPYSATRALPLQPPSLGRVGDSGPLFLGQPTEAPAQQPPPQQQGGSLFAQTANTPLGSPRFARCVAHLIGM